MERNENGTRKEFKIDLPIGGKFKIFGISEFMAHTFKMEVVIKSFDENRQKYTFSQIGKRKEFYLNIDSSSLIVPIESKLKADSETGSFSGNTLLNFVGDVKDIKAIIEKENLNPFLDKSVIVASDEKDRQKETPVYFELAKANAHNHAVMQRILEKNKEVV